MSDLHTDLDIKVSAYIRWAIEFELREWGVKYANVVIREITLLIENEDAIPTQETINLDDYQIFDDLCEVNFSLACPNFVVINHEQKKIHVSF